MGRDGQGAQGVAGDLHPVAGQGPGGLITAEVEKIHAVGDGEDAPLEILRLHPRRLISGLDLAQAGLDPAVGCDQPVDAEVAVVELFARVAAVEETGLAVLRLVGADGVVAPLPDEAAHEVVVGVDEVPVILQVAGAVAHSVAVFAQQEGAGLVGVLLADDTTELRGGIHP